MENNVNTQPKSQIYKEKSVKYFKNHYKKSQQKKARIKKMTKQQRIVYYTKDLFINSCLAFVWDFLLRVVFSWIFFKGKLPDSFLGYFIDFLFVKYGLYYTVIWVISLVAVINYLWRKDKNIKIFYLCWLSLLVICASQILIDLRVYIDFLKLVITFNIFKIIDLFQNHSFQIEIFVLLWSIKNIFRFVYVTNSMTKISINFTPIED